MKKLSLLFLSILLAVVSFAQVPNNFKYQAVVRGNTGNVLADKAISVQLSILQGSMTGSTIYVEDFSVTTNSFGLINLNVGSGNTTDDFSSIDWSAGPYFLLVEIDENGGSAYSEMGTSQLLSVPFSLYAKDVENKDDADADPSNELQTLNMNNDTLYLTNGGKIYLGNYNNLWQKNGNNIYYNDGWVGVGTDTPSGKMVVQGDSGVNPDSALFEVKNKNGQTIFAVYDGGVRIWVDNTETKASTDKGGFAVAGYRNDKSISHEFLRITPDSARIYYDNENTGTGHEGGFQVEGFAGSTSESNGGTMHLSDDNYFIGDSAGIYVTPSGLYNSTFGYKAGKSLTIADNSVLIGYEAGTNITTANSNIFLGYKTGYNTTIGRENNMIGYKSGFNNTTGHYNNFMGWESGVNNTTGMSNTFIGDWAGKGNIVGNFNTFIGSESGTKSDSSSNNVFIGSYSGHDANDGDNNVMIGYKVGYVNIASNNSFIGTESGRYNTTGDKNIFFGYHAGYKNTTGKHNTYIGNNAGYYGTENKYNVAIGDSAGANNTANYNVFIGNESGRDNKSGGSNCFIGNQSGAANVSGVGNTYVGWGAGAAMKGNNNVAVGLWTAAFAGSSTGTENVLLGYGAGLSNHGSYNVLVGALTGNSDADYEVLIGYNIDNSRNNTLIINGNGNTNPLIYGEFDNDKFQINHKTGSTYAGIHINNYNTAETWSLYQYSSGELHLLYNGSNRGSWNSTSGAYTSVSDVRYKKNIVDMSSIMEKVMQLEAKTYNFKSQTNDDTKYLGFIAQDAIKLFPSLVSHSNPKGLEGEEEIYMIDYAGFSVVAIQAIKEQQKTIESLEQRIEKLEKLLLEK